MQRIAPRVGVGAAARVVRFARLMHRRAAFWGTLLRCAFGGNQGLARLHPR